jgi:hypothetical protein
MGMTPSQYFESFVEGNHEDCHEHPGCVRRAFNAAVAASHLADHFFAFNFRHHRQVVEAYPTIGPFVAHLEAQTGGAFRDIRSIANAYKHLYTDIDPRRAAQSNVTSSGSIDSIDLPEQAELTHISEEYVANGSTVVFRRKDGSTSEFLPVLDKFVDYWRESVYGGP